MAIDYTSYGSLVEANIYFDNRLYSGAWFERTVRDRERAILAATRLLNVLNYKGCKSDDAQPLEFPRDVSNGSIPSEIVEACYELAYALVVDGRDPEAELDALGITSQGISSVRTTYNRLELTHEHIMSGIVSLHAWRLLHPWLNQKETICLDRVN